ncbi:unnamed protein product [Polarella glacialis]|uniref:Uncharacterized protein n=1 Tax=Polarella glacialis TaxID=89957 RepID=A0A813HR22_POLGL|nr:unnamed protein product [Polarella glacialis]
MIDPSLIMIVSASFLRFPVDLLVDNAAVPSSLCNWACWSFIGALLTFVSPLPPLFPFVRIRQRLPKDWKCSTICVWPVTVLLLPSRLKFCGVLAVFSLPGFASASA